jgi:putative DNA primase/helicase
LFAFFIFLTGDTVRAQRKHAQPFDFRNYSKLIFSTNQIPQSDDNTYADFKRWIIFSFDRIFQGETKDTNLIAKLTTEDELSGLLNLVLIALKQLIKDNEFKYADDVETTKIKYGQNASSVDGFLSHKCYIDRTDRSCYSLSTDLYRCYVLYCKENDMIPIADNVFGSRLAAIGISKERKMVNGFRCYCYIGISLL